MRLHSAYPGHQTCQEVSISVIILMLFTPGKPENSVFWLFHPVEHRGAPDHDHRGVRAGRLQAADRVHPHRLSDPAAQDTAGGHERCRLLRVGRVETRLLRLHTGQSLIPNLYLILNIILLILNPLTLRDTGLYFLFSFSHWLDWIDFINIGGKVVSVVYK